MAVGKGILLEVEGRQGIVLTPQGEFRRVRLRQPARVGDEVTFDAAPARWWWWVAAAAAVVLAVAAPLAYPLLAVGPAVAVVALDINPSLEFLADARDRVVVARPRNDDGAALLDRLGRVRGLPVEEAVARAVDQAVALGKLRPEDVDALVLITVAPVPGDGALPPGGQRRLEERAQAAAAAHLAQRGAQVQVRTLAVSAGEAAAAGQKGLSVGKYALCQGLLAAVPDLGVGADQCARLPLGQLKHMAQERGIRGLGDLLDRVQRGHDLRGPGGGGPGGRGGEQGGPGAGEPGAGGPGRGRGGGQEDRGAPGGPGKGDPAKGDRGKGGQGRGPDGGGLPGLPGLGQGGLLPLPRDVDLPSLIPGGGEDRPGHGRGQGGGPEQRSGPGGGGHGQGDASDGSGHRDGRGSGSQGRGGAEGGTRERGDRGGGGHGHRSEPDGTPDARGKGDGGGRGQGPGPEGSPAPPPGDPDRGGDRDGSPRHGQERPSLDPKGHGGEVRDGGESNPVTSRGRDGHGPGEAPGRGRDPAGGARR